MPEKKKRPDEETLQIEIRDNILDNLDIAIMVSDMLTNEILYANKKMQQMYEDTSLVGRICWEALEKRDKRCNDCPVSRLLKNPKESYQHETYEEDGCFRITDSIITWSGDILAHLRYIIPPQNKKGSVEFCVL